MPINRIAMIDGYGTPFAGDFGERRGGKKRRKHKATRKKSCKGLHGWQRKFCISAHRCRRAVSQSVRQRRAAIKRMHGHTYQDCMHFHLGKKRRSKRR